MVRMSTQERYCLKPYVCGNTMSHTAAETRFQHI